MIIAVVGGITMEPTIPLSRNKSSNMEYIEDGFDTMLEYFDG
jgi:hypothetical protein